jgi:2-aminobenzoate-CoA ligase
MKDRYPQLATLPSEWLVSPADQPEYIDIPGFHLDESVDLGSALSDAHVVAGRGDTAAVVHHETGHTLSYRDLAELSDKLAAGLYEQGVREGERVALRGPNCPELLIAAVATWKLGAVVALVPVLARPADIEFYLEDTRPSAFLLAGSEGDAELAAIEAGSVRTLVAVEDSGRRGWLSWASLAATRSPRPDMPVDLDRIAIVWHTGGTTGRPKGCYHTQRRYLLAGESIRRSTHAAPGQRWAAAAPIGHALGFIMSTNFTLLHGATLVLIESFAKPEVILESINEYGITNFTAIAATWARMLALLESGRGIEPITLRVAFAMWQSASASEVSDGWRRRGVELLNNFGSTAFATWVLVPPLDRDVPQAALGVPAAGYEVRLMDPSGGPDVTVDGVPGRMAVRGPSGLTYWRLPDKQRQDVRDGWSIQDDLISMRDRFAHYLGRTDFLISTAGHKVAPGEVEAVLNTHPAVREVLVMGLPDPLRHEMVAAFVVARDPAAAGPELTKELQDYVKARLSPYKYPRHVEFLDALPRDDVGKVQPKFLRARVLETLSVSSAKAAAT